MDFRDDVRKRAERLVELDRRAAESRGIGDAGLTPLEWEELQIFVKPGMDTLLEFARAYLAECEAHERTKEAAKLLAQEILNAHKVRGHALTAAAGDVDAVIMARDFLASIEQKEDSQDA